MTRLRWIAWIWGAGIVLLSVVPAAVRPVATEHHVEHMLAFALLGGLFHCAYRGRDRAVMGGLILFTLALELIQLEVPTRHARFEDFVVNSLGCLVGAALASGLCALARALTSSPGIGRD